MKMTKIESAKKIVECKGECTHPNAIYCEDCFTTTEKCGYDSLELKTITSEQWYAKKIKLGEAFIKRHKGKSKKVKAVQDQTIANIFGLHIGCRVKVKDNGADVTGVIETVAINGGDSIVVKIDSDSDREWDCIVVDINKENPKLILKPLSKITDEDKAEFRRIFKIKEKILGFDINGAVLVCTEFTDFDGDPMDKYDDITSTQLVWLALKGYDIGLVPNEYKEVEE